MSKVVICVLGKDRPGIVCKVSSVMASHGCNIEDISQTVLQGEFCGMFVLSLPQGFSLASLKHVLEEKLSPEGLQVLCKILEDGDREKKQSYTEPFVVVSIGADRVGLIAAISCIMYSHGVNITNLKFINRTPAFPEKTITIYEVDIPRGVKLSDFVRDLEQRAKELGLDITVQHKRIFEDTCRI